MFDLHALFSCVRSASLFKHEDLLDFFHVLLSAVAYAWIFHDHFENDSKPFHYNFRATKSNDFPFRFSSVEHRISSTDQSVYVWQKEHILWIEEKYHNTGLQTVRANVLECSLFFLGYEKFIFRCGFWCCNTHSWPFLWGFEMPLYAAHVVRAFNKFHKYVFVSSRPCVFVHNTCGKHHSNAIVVCDGDATRK